MGEVFPHLRQVRNEDVTWMRVWQVNRNESKESELLT